MYLVFDEDYYYLFGLSENAQKQKHVKLAFHTRRASTILAFEVVGKGEVFLPSRL